MNKYLATTLLALLLLPIIEACRPNSGDGVMERPNYTMVNYQLTFTDHFLQFYDVTATYQTVDGKELTETMTTQTWQYKEKSEEQYSNLYLSVVATAKPKDKRGTLNDKVETIELSCDYSVEYYSKATSAKRIHNKGAYASVKRENIDDYLAEHPNVKVCEVNMNSFSE